MLSSGNLGKEFGSGGGLAVRVRYRMRFERAIGLTFDAHQLSARDAEKFAFQNTAFDSLQDAATVSRDRLKLVTAGIEFYQMFDTRTRTTKYVSAGVGLAQLSAHLTSGETQFPIAGDGLYISAGAGLERFFFRSMAWDMGARYMAIFHDGEMNHDLQLQAGLIFYAAY
jgi:opacity protein-like surface antigen